MYAFITGNLVSEGVNEIVIENNGIGYLLYVSGTTIVKLKQQPMPVKVYTYLNVKEDEMSLYGFYGEDEKDMFMKLISVSGVGAKTAIQILSGASVQDLTVSIASCDTSRFSKIKGIGKKTAERIVLELKDKVSTLPLLNNPVSETPVFSSTAEQEAESALMALGFSKAEAHRAVKSVSGAESAEDIIKQALIKMSR
ncbi:MAG: Holliday junction branch migration protein RuvA [Clostridia bacterium]|nr:Holliday junction branch migration protein RuvA [Clostridia bacterium]